MVVLPLLRTAAAAFFVAVFLLPVGLAQTLAAVESPADPPAKAEQASPVALLPYLDSLIYDSTQRGPLLVVLPRDPLVAHRSLPSGRASLPAIAEASDRRVVSAGQVRVLVPRTITTIAAGPGKADPFGEVTPYIATELLMGTFTADQWRLIGTDSGIGLPDLRPDQRTLWKRFIPEGTRIADAGKEIRLDPTTVRLHITKQTSLILMEPNKPHVVAASYDPTEERAPNGTWGYTIDFPDKKPPKSDRGRVAYGARWIVTQPNHLKPGQLDFRTAALNKQIALPARTHTDSTKALPILSDLLRRISSATGLDIRADRRLAKLAIFSRGDEARAGDLLIALAWSVGGAFRKLEATHPGEAPIYLLTEDIAGIGTRAARMGDWANLTERRLYHLQADAVMRASALNPQQYLHYAPNDPLNPGDARVAEIENALRENRLKFLPTLKISEMPSAFQKAVRAILGNKQAAHPEKTLDTANVDYCEVLCASFLIPEGRASGLTLSVPIPFWEHFSPKEHFQDSRPHKPDILAPLHSPGQSGHHSIAPLFPPKPSRRILIARAGGPAEAAELARAASHRGFTQLWLQVSLADTGTARLVLSAAIKAVPVKGKAGAGNASFSIGALVSLLRDNGLPGGTPARNIFGEDGATFAARKYREEYSDIVAPLSLQQWRERLQYLSGWTIPDNNGADLTRRMARLAVTPGLAALALQGTTPQGFQGFDQARDRYDSFGDFGYTLAERRAILTQTGFDPIDLMVHAASPLLDGRLDWNALTYFPTWATLTGEDQIAPPAFSYLEGPMGVLPVGIGVIELWKARARARDHLLSSVHGAIRKAAPTTPLYMEYATIHGFAPWTTETVPLPGRSYGLDVSAPALEPSVGALDYWEPPFVWMTKKNLPYFTPGVFADAIRAATAQSNDPLHHLPINPASVSGYSGITLDMTGVPANKLLTLLDGLPLTGK